MGEGGFVEPNGKALCHHHLLGVVPVISIYQPGLSTATIHEVYGVSERCTKYQLRSPILEDMKNI